MRVRHDGTVSATTPGPADALADTRLFTLPPTDATDLLGVLRDAEGAVDLDAGQVSRRIAPFTHEDGPRKAAAPSVQLLDSEPRHAEVPPDGRATALDMEDANCRSEQASSPDSGKQSPSRRPLFVRVLGHVRLTLHDDAGEREIAGVLTPRQQEVLVYLALHPQGVRREALNEAIWPESRSPRPYNSFHNTLSTLRRALADTSGGRLTDLVLNENGRYRINRELTTVDFWQLQRALQEHSSANSDARSRLCDVIALYEGELAEDLLVPWIEPFRESVRRDVLDVLGVLIREADPETMLALLERIRTLDRYNEGVYRDIIRTQARLGQHAAIPRTIALLKSVLDEIDQHPTAETLNLAEFLQRRGSTTRPLHGDDAAAS